MAEMLGQESLRDRVILVVGASRGIGAGVAGRLAAAGARVMLAARDDAALAAVAARIERAGGSVAIRATDIDEPGEMERLVAATCERFGRLDGAFNNATAGGWPAPLVEVADEMFEAAMRTNAWGTFLGLKHQIAAMLRAGGGSIVNMASVAGVLGVANLAGYVAGKAAIIALTKVAALDYADRNIRVNVVAPGPILTHHLETAGAEARRQAARATPMRRVGTITEVAEAVAWLLSDASGFITGITLPIDGGQSAGLKPASMYRQSETMEPA